MYCEGKYFCEFQGNRILMGVRGQSTSYSVKELLAVNQFVLDFGNHMRAFLNLNSFVKPDESSTIKIFFEHGDDANTMVINYWLSKHEPSTDITYVGKMKPKEKQSHQHYRFTMKVPSHLWTLLLGAQFVDKDIFLCDIINAFFKVASNKEKEFDTNKYLRFMMYSDNDYMPPYIYGYLRPNITNVNIDYEKDYLIEITYPDNRGFYYTIKKSKLVNGKINCEDLKSLD